MLGLLIDLQIHYRSATQNRIDHTPIGIIILEKDST